MDENKENLVEKNKELSPEELKKLEDKEKFDTVEDVYNDLYDEWEENIDKKEKISNEDIPLEIIKSYLRIDHDLDDTEIKLCFLSAICYVKKYIGVDKSDELDDDLVLPILSLTCHFYENKDITQPSNQKMDEIFSSVLNLNRVSIL